jgi:hypothetical protein
VELDLVAVGVEAEDGDSVFTEVDRSTGKEVVGLQVLHDAGDRLRLDAEGEVARTRAAMARRAVEAQLNAAAGRLHRCNPRVPALQLEPEHLAVELLRLRQVPHLQDKLRDAVYGDHVCLLTPASLRGQALP